MRVAGSQGRGPLGRGLGWREGRACHPATLPPITRCSSDLGPTVAVTSTGSSAEAVALAHAAAASAVLAADSPGLHAGADAIEARATAAVISNINKISARGAESLADTANTAAETPCALARAAIADRSERAGVEAGTAVSRVTR
jgi:hypothetical protein